MAETTSRTLQLLSLLQAHRQWAGPELADRLGVTERTLRRDIDRVRELGYRIEAVRGPAGGYRLEAGSQLPPLLLNDEEAVSMAIGMRVAAALDLIDGELTAQSALAKFEQVLPSALRHRVSALASHVETANSPASGSTPVSQELLGALALACRDSERIRFHYVAASGVETERVVEPHSLVAAARRWFLVCWDLDRVEWRTFRVDRLSRFFATRLRFAPRELPAGTAAEFVATAVASARARHSMVVEIRIALPVFRERFAQWGTNATALDDGWTRWPVDGETVEQLFGALAWIPAGVEYRVSGSAELVDFCRESAARLMAAVAG